jgi:hypothetical protein
MRLEASVTSISWIPSEAISGFALRVPFDVGIAHYDEPPPDRLSDLEQLSRDDRFRFANRLSAFIEVENGEIVHCGHSGDGVLGATTLRLGQVPVIFRATAFPTLRSTERDTPGEVTFVQTSGGRTGVPVPRHVRSRPFVQWCAPTAWTTLALTLRADGSSSLELRGASSFPRHWIYDASGALVAKSGLIDYANWSQSAFGAHTPWGDEDSPALVTAVESALERQLSTEIMRGGDKPAIRSLRAGSAIAVEGEPGDDLFLVLDGVVAVEKHGETLAEYGPGSLHGERAFLEAGRRTATLRAVTACKLAVAPGDGLDPSALALLSSSHRREDG